MRDQKNTLKYFYPVILTIIITGLSSQYSVAQSGPTQPEAMQFEPVDVTDVVNLATGDFVYTLPLMEVPGPEGSYPIVLSYHSNIGPNQPATWVGLGWTLNPGSINRTLSGYPDDYNGDLVRTHYEDYEDLDWGISIGAGWGPVGLNMTYDHYSGMVGANMMVNIAPKELSQLGISAKASIGSNGVSTSIGYGKYLGGGFAGNIGISAGTQGFNVKGGLGSLGAQIGGSIGSNGYNASFSSSGVSISSESNGSSFNIGGLGFSSVTQSSGRGTISTRGFSTPRIPLPGGFWVSFGYQEREWRLNETYIEPSYGYLYQDQYLESGEHNKKYERQVQNDFLYASADIFNANAQGLSGMFTAYQSNPYQLFDKEENDEKANLTNDWDYYQFQINEDKKFRFLDDAGGNVVIDNYYAKWGKRYKEIKKRFSSSVPRYSGRKIIPIFNEESGKLEGFTVIDSDGKQCEFNQPVSNLYQYSETQKAGSDDEYKNYNTMATPYATSWLLTAIKGPDYLDRNNNDNVDDGDWGYWIKIKYESSSKPHVWRSPYKGFSPSPNSEKTKSFSIGLREAFYMSEIETASHLLKFKRINAKSVNVNPDLNQLLALGNEYQKVGNKDELTFKGDYSWIDKIAGVEPDQNVLTILLKYLDDNNSYDYLNIEIPYKRLDFNFTGNELKLSFDELEDTHYAILYGILDLKQILQNQSISSEKLSSIELFNKKDLQYRIKSVEFDYDYSLRPNTPGSRADKTDGASKGAMTLKSVRFLGRNNTPIMPPYRFEYANGNSPSIGLNPSWHKNDWDHWGSYRDPGSGRGFNQHKTPQDKNLADKSAAWALTEITNPTGSKVEIEYESDDYYHVNNTIDFDKACQLPIVTRGENIKTIELEEGIDSIYSGKKVYILKRSYYQGQYNNLSYNIIKDPFSIESVSSTNETITLDRSFDFEDSYRSGTYQISYSYYLIDSPSKVFGGGSRVKSIVTKDASSYHRTKYDYIKSDGKTSSGVTASLPAPYSDQKHNLEVAGSGQAVPGSYLQAFMDHRYSYGRPAPGVIYSRVQVVNTDKSGKNINGKTAYEFYTSHDFPYTVDDDKDLKNFDKGELSITDRSGIYGKPKATTFYEKVGQNKFRPVKRNEFVYAYSDELNDKGSLYIKGNELEDEKKIPGIIQQKYAFRNQQSDYQTVERKVDHTYMNVYGAGQQSTSYFYADEKSLNPDDSLVTNSLPFGWDAYTGSAILTAQSTSDTDETIVNEATPAYWKYEGMESKNMLTQNFQQSTYKTNSLDLDNTTSLKSYETEAGELLSSTVTTWSDHWYDGKSGSPKIWRKNDTYVYDKGYAYKDFQKSEKDKTTETYLRPDKDTPWKQTSNITKYDEFGHTVESISQDGRYTTALYRSNQRLVKGIASNTAKNEIVFRNYENSSSASTNAAHSGLASRRVSGTTTLADAPNVTPKNASKYKAQLWVMASGGDLKIDGQTVKKGSGWTYVDLNNISPGQAVRIQGSGYVDDLAIIPETATLSSYTYDPLTDQLTSITDANNNTSYFEYDNAGRLIAKRDLDKNLVQRYSYGYGNFYNISISDESPVENQKVIFTAETHLQTNGPLTYTWDFGTGERQSTTVPEVDHIFYDSGFKTVSLLITDKENTNIRVRRRFYVIGEGEDDFSIDLYVESDPGDFKGIVRAEVKRGTKPYSYEWFKKGKNENDWEISSGGSVLKIGFLGFDKEIRVKCRVTDAEGRSLFSESLILVGPSHP